MITYLFTRGLPTKSIIGIVIPRVGTGYTMRLREIFLRDIARSYLILEKRVEERERVIQ